MKEIDALIVGAGVAGCATAHELLSAGATVAILHRDDTISGIESIPSETSRRLDSLSISVGSSFSEVIAWWGSDTPSRMTCLGARAVQRTLLANTLRSLVHNERATLEPSQSSLTFERHNGWWQVNFKTSECTTTMKARRLVDATGRMSTVARSLGARRLAVDHLCSLSLSIHDPGPAGTWTESVANGWWNLCSDGREATLSFYSDAETIRIAKHRVVQYFSQTSHMKHLVTPSFNGSMRVRSCGSSRVEPCGGSGWIAVGDAAMTFQPLASAGVATAFHDAKIARQVLEAEPDVYDNIQCTKFDRYLEQLTGQYALENRWTESPFWRRRHVAD